MVLDYVHFCTDLCVPKKSFTMRTIQKLWMTKHIIEMIGHKEKHHQHRSRSSKMKRDISKSITKAKQNHLSKIQHQLAKEPARAWADIKK